MDSDDGTEPAEDATTVRLAVPDMDCPSCAGKVESALDGVEGVVGTDLRPTSGTAAVRYDPAVTDRADVEDAVEAAGYRVASAGEGGDAAAEMAPATAVWWSRRALQTWAAAVALAAGLAVAFLLPGLDATVATVLGRTVTVADAAMLAAVALAGGPVVRNGYYSLRNLNLDIDLLMGAAILGATAIWYLEEAATLAVLFGIAELMEQYAMGRARSSLRELVELAPDEATVIEDGERRTVPADAVAPGDRVAVRPGEKIPADGTVAEGASAVDESPITGESVPADKREGDEVYAGTINVEGYLEVTATAAAEDTTLARIVEQVEDAEANKTEREQFVERFAAVYTPVVVVLALLAMTVPPLLLGAPARTWFVRGLTLLVISCPCAFVISTPVSVVSAVTSAARNGVLIEGGDRLEAMGAVGAVAVDKTGTLTRGELAVTDVVPLGDRDEAELLGVAAALERRSEHPIGRAIRDRADELGTDRREVAAFESITGRGVRATIDGTGHYAGKPALFADRAVDLGHLHVATDGGTPAVGQDAPPDALAADDRCDRGGCVDLRDGLVPRLEREGKTVVVVGTDEAVHGVVAVADSVRAGAADAVAGLQGHGLDIVMLTGDNAGTARAIAEQVGIDEYRADLLPEEKVAAVEELGERYDGGVAMVGDGVNDAPALAAAGVGVAMGAAGTDTAIETADVALMGDDLHALPYLYRLANSANGVIRQNVWSSLGVKFVLAAGVPLGYVTVALAVLVGDMGMSLGVTANAMRLSRIVPDRSE